MTFRTDGSWLSTLTKRFGADTFSCTQKHGGAVAGGLLVSWYWFDEGGQQIDTVVVKDQELSIASYNDEIFKRVAAPAGLPQDHIVFEPVPPVTASGKLATVVGSWERVLGQGVQRQSDATLIRKTLLLRPDLTYMERETWKDGADTFSCALEWYWEDSTVAGDTLVLMNMNGHNVRKYIVQDQQLLEFWNDEPKPSQVYTRTTSVQQP